MTKDPVCSGEINENQAVACKLTSDFDGQTYYFCSADCKKNFDADPAAFIVQLRWPEDWESQGNDDYVK